MTNERIVIAILALLLTVISISCTAGAWSLVREKTYDQNRFSIFSRDYFSRFSKDPSAKPLKNEIIIDQNWTIIKPAKIDPVVQQMMNDFAVFMDKRMNTKLIQTTEQKSGKRLIFIAEAKRYGLKTYIHVNTPVFIHEALVFVAHPGIRGAEINRGVYVMQ